MIAKVRAAEDAEYRKGEKSPRPDAGYFDLTIADFGGRRFGLAERNDPGRLPAFDFNNLDLLADLILDFQLGGNIVSQLADFRRFAAAKTPQPGSLGLHGLHQRVQRHDLLLKTGNRKIAIVNRFVTETG